MTGIPNSLDSDPNVHNNEMESADPHVAFEKNKEDTEYLETLPTNLSVVDQEAKQLNAIESLGIEDWQAKEKRIVQRLDMTLLPQLWALYSMELVCTLIKSRMER